MLAGDRWDPQSSSWRELNDISLFAERWAGWRNPRERRNIQRSNGRILHCARHKRSVGGSSVTRTYERQPLDKHRGHRRRNADIAESWTWPGGGEQRDSFALWCLSFLGRKSTGYRREPGWRPPWGMEQSTLRTTSVGGDKCQWFLNMEMFSITKLVMGERMTIFGGGTGAVILFYTAGRKMDWFIFFWKAT